MRVQDIKNEVSSRSTGVITRTRSIPSLPPPVPSRSSSRGQSSSSIEYATNQPADQNNNEHSDNSVPDASTGRYDVRRPTRMKSLDMDEKMTSSRRIKSSSFGSGDLIRPTKSQVLSNRRLLQRLQDSSNADRAREEVSVTLRGYEGEGSPSETTTTGVGEVSAAIRPPRRAQSLRSHRPLSSSSRTLSLNSCSTIEEQEIPRPPPVQVRRKRRGLRRSQSSIVVSDAATTATVASESSKSSGSTNSSSSSTTTSSSKQSGLKRCSSLDRRLDRRVRGDQAPTTPLRGPPSPITSDDSSASPPQIDNDFDLTSLPPPLSRKDDGFKHDPVPLTAPAGPIVSTSKIRLNTRQRSKRLLKSLSESKIHTNDDTNESHPRIPFSSSLSTWDQADPSSSVSTLAPTSSTETSALPSASLGSPQTTTRLWSDIIEMSQKQKSNRRIQSVRTKTVEKDTRQRTFGFSRLARSFSSGGNKNIRRNFSATSTYPVKSPRNVVDDSTRSDTERTASTVSTSQSDFSSLHSLREDCISPSHLTSPSDPVVDLNSYSKLLSRLRTDFDLPPATENDEFHSYQTPRRPASMSSLMTHIAMEKDRTDRGRGKEEDDDDDSTIMSNIDAPPVRTTRSRSSSGSRRRRRREKLTHLTSSSSDSKVVCFGNVNVREYERCVGDNPAVTSGVPIGLGWNYSTYLDVDVDIYESSVRKPGPRTRKDFVLTPQDRLQILRDECGYSPKEIHQAKELAAEVRYQRQVSVFGETGAQHQLQTDSPPMYPVKRNPRGTYRRMRSTGSLQLPPLPLTDNRWGTSCPAAPSNENSQ